MKAEKRKILLSIGSSFPFLQNIAAKTSENPRPPKFAGAVATAIRSAALGYLRSHLEPSTERCESENSRAAASV
jgi:hypothetical protein